jgi:hypothetical protein
MLYERTAIEAAERGLSTRSRRMLLLLLLSNSPDQTWRNQVGIWLGDRWFLQKTGGKATYSNSKVHNGRNSKTATATPTEARIPISTPSISKRLRFSSKQDQDDAAFTDSWILRIPIMHLPILERGPAPCHPVRGRFNPSSSRRQHHEGKSKTFKQYLKSTIICALLTNSLPGTGRSE